MEQSREINPLVSVIILAYNGVGVIGDCLNSIFGQTYGNIEVIAVDNGSADKTREMILQYGENNSSRENRSQKIELIRNSKNIGFAGHNIGIENSNGEYVLCVNQDIILEPNFISEAIKLFQQDEKIGVIQPKMINRNNRKIIDSTGIKIFKSRRMVDRGQGEEDKGQYDKIEEVFGANGAVAFFRKKCLEDVRIKIPNTQYPIPNEYEYYDRDFFLYKEDVDLSWRIRLYGWKIIYCPKAIVYTDRTSKPLNEKEGIGRVIKTRKRQKGYVQYLSFKNHRLAIIKNDLPWLFIKHLPWILPREIGYWLYVLFFEPKTWPATGKLSRQMPSAFRKRKVIMKNKKAGAREMERWFQ